MKTKLTLLSLAVMLLTTAAYIAFHPGVRIIEPRMAYAAETPMGQARYKIDPNHASIYFEITHSGLSQIHGRFNTFEGVIVEDAQNLDNSGVDFTAQVESIDTAIEGRDKHLRSADFFDVAQFPTLSFKSSGVEECDEGYILHGDLTLKGVTKPVEIPFTHHGPKTSQGKDGKSITRIGVVAEPITILRSDFGVGNTTPGPDGTLGLSNEVKIYISFEAILDAPTAE